MSIRSGLIILDRDGVLNEMVVHPDHGLVDSPMNIDEVVMAAQAPEAVSQLNAMGFTVCIATNQPAAAKGKTSRILLETVHQRILDLAQSKGGVISKSFICWHREEDRCACRKPKTGLLEEAIKAYPHFRHDQIWMVGDGITDIEAGQALNLRTAFLGPQKCSYCKALELKALYPTIWAGNLWQLTQGFSKLEA